MMKRLHWMAACLFAFLVLGTGSASAAGYPDKPIKIVVPYSAGGAVDLVARVVGNQMSSQMGVPVIVENRPGANANLAADLVAKADPDGYTLLLSANALATNTTLFPHTTFKVLRDFVPIARVGHAPLVIVVPSSSKIMSLKDLIAAAQQAPGKMNYGSPGNGSSQHLAGEMLKIAAKIDVLHVPYKGGAPALTDLLGGRIDYMIQNPIEVVPHIKAGRLRAIAAASATRLPLLPDVPTAAEAGLPGFEASVWWGMVAPAKTPKDIVAKLNAEVVKAINDPAVKEKLGAMGVITTPGTAEQFGGFLKDETERWAKVIKTAGIQVN